MHKDLRPLVAAAKTEGWMVEKRSGEHTYHLVSPDGKQRVPLTDNIRAGFGLANKVKQLEAYGVPVRAYIRGEINNKTKWNGHEENLRELEELDKALAEGDYEEVPEPTAEVDEQKWVTVKRAAEIMGYTTNYVNALVKAKRLEFKFEKRGTDGRMVGVEVDLDSVKQFLARGAPRRPRGIVGNTEKRAKRLELKPIVVNALEIHSAVAMVEEVQHRLLSFYDELEFVKEAVKKVIAPKEEENE